MIRKLTAKHFEGIETAELELGPITALYGANGAGKSSLRDAIEHVLTGEPCRGGVLAEVVRQGARSAEVEVLLENGSPEGLSIIRRRSKSGGKQMVSGVELTAGEAQAAVEKTVGAPVRAITAALRAGAILELKPDELQALLAGLTGAAFDEKAISEAVGADVSAAAARAGLQLPKRFEDLPSFGKAAEGARQLAKRQLAEREADLDRTPQGKPGDEKALLANLKDLRARRETAARGQAHDAGAREEKLRQMRAELAELAQVPEIEAPPDDSAENALAKADGEAQDAEWKSGAARARLAELKKEAGEDAAEDEALIARSDEITAALKAARNAHADAKKLAEQLVVDGKQQKALLDRIPEAGCVGPCPVLPETECPLKDLSGLREKLTAATAVLRDRWHEANSAEVKASAEVRAAEAEAKRLEAALQRRESRSRVAALETELGQLQAQLERAQAEASRLQPVVDANRAARQAALRHSEAQKKARAIEAEIAALEKQPASGPAEDVAQLDAQIAAAEAALADSAQAEKRQAVEAAVAKAKRSVADSDAVAQACKTARVALLAKAVQPFTAAANGALAKLAPGYAVEIGDSLELCVRKGDMSLRPAQLSDGERTRLLYVLQFAVCKLAGVKLLPLDRGELLDAAGKAALMKLVGEAAKEGIQLLMLSCAAPPESAPQGVSVYVVDGGRVRSVARKAA